MDHAVLQGGRKKRAAHLSESTQPPKSQPSTQTMTTDAYKSFRLSISGLQVKPDKQRVKELVGSAIGCSNEQVDVHSIATDPVVPKMIMATLEFTNIPESLSQLSKESKHKVSLRDCNLVFDYHFLGLTALTDPEENQWAIDVVAVSGLNGHPFGSFKTRGGNWMWLRDGLSQDIPGARVLAYGLNTELTHSKSSQNIIDLGRHCREALFSISSETSKPLILIGHSLGGIILREALNLMGKASEKNEEDRKFLRTLAAILLFGVPSQGMAIGSLQPMVGDGPNRQLLETLSVNSAFLQDQSETFRKTHTLPFVNFDIVSFYETEMSQTAKQDEDTEQWSMTGPLDFLVDRHSATQGQANGAEKHRVYPVPSSHGDVVKFEDQGDATYRIVLRELRRMLRFKPQTCRGLETAEKACLRSLSFPDQATREVEIQPTEGTCEWLVHHPTYQTWLHSSCDLLWIRGNPGTGKSMVMKSLLQHARAASTPEDMIASFFIHGRGNALQKTELGLYRSLTHQLYQRFPDDFSALTAFFKKNDDDYGDPDSGKWEWMSQVLLEHLSHALNTISRRCAVIILVDALDEAGETAAEAIVKDFKSILAATEKNSRLKICFSCRHYPQITLDGGTPIVMEDHNGADINRIVDYQLRYSGFEEWEKDRLKVVARTRSQGIIQWVTLVISRVIGNRTHGRTFKEALELVREVPEGLDELYMSLLPADCHGSRSKTRDRKLALKLFQWVLYAGSPLSAWELQQALALDYDVESKSTVEFQSGNDYIDLKDLHLRLKSLSQGLIEIKGDVKTGSVQFIHQSVVDFLLDPKKALNFLSGGSELPPARLAHFQLSRSCLRYLLIEDVCDILSDSKSRRGWPGEVWAKYQDGIQDRPTTTLHCFPKLPFVLYTWRYWIYHFYEAQKSSVSGFDDLDNVDLFDLSQRKKSDDQEKQLRKFYEFLGFPAYTGVRLENIEFPWTEENLLPCIFSFYGSQIQIQKLLDARLGELRKSRLQNSPLNFAICGRQNAIAKMLIRRRVGLDRRSRVFPQLELACELGETDLVSMLLKRGCKSHRKSSSVVRETPLGRAVLAGHIEVIDILLGAGAKLNATDPVGNTVLHGVIPFQTSPRVVHHLIQQGADISSRNRNGATPLHLAAEFNEVSMINAILEHESLNQGVRKKSAFFSIGLNTNREKIERSKSLLINTTDKEGLTPFAYSVRWHHLDAMRVLLKAGSEVDFRDKDNFTLLMWACGFSDVEVVRFLLDAGADVNVRGRNDLTCLMMACERVNSGVIRFLLENGLQSANAITPTGDTALWTVILTDHRLDDMSAELVKILIQSGAEVNIRRRSGISSLMKAAFWGMFQTCAFLLNEGAEVHVEDETRRTALIYAVIGAKYRLEQFKGDLLERRKAEEPRTMALLELLLSFGADATVMDDSEKSALHYAHPQQTKIVRLLREAGSDGEPEPVDPWEQGIDWSLKFL